MPAYSAIGEWAVAEFPDPTGTLRLPTADLVLESEAPVVLGGASVQPGYAQFDLQSVSHVVRAGGSVKVSTSPVTLTSGHPVIGFGAIVRLPSAVGYLTSSPPRVGGGVIIVLAAASADLMSVAPHVATGGTIILDAAEALLDTDAPSIVQMVNVRPRAAMLRLTSSPPQMTRAALVQAWMSERLISGASVAEVAVAEAGPSRYRDVTQGFVLLSPAPLITAGGAVHIPDAATVQLTGLPVSIVLRRRRPAIQAIAS